MSSGFVSLLRIRDMTSLRFSGGNFKLETSKGEPPSERSSAGRNRTRMDSMSRMKAKKSEHLDVHQAG